MLRADLIDLDELLEYPANPKLHDVSAIADSISEHGFIQRCTVNEVTGFLLSGHGRRLALQRMRGQGSAPPDNIVVEGGRWLVPVDVIAVPTEQEDEIVILLNQLTVKGGWDHKKLVMMLKTIEAQGALSRTCFSRTDLKRLARSAFPPNPDDPSVTLSLARELQAQYGTETGQVWRVCNPQTGLEHRVLCGDNQDQGATAGLLRGANIQAIITDPPFELSPAAIRCALDLFAPRATVLLGLGWRPFDLPREGWVARLDLVWEREGVQSFIHQGMPVVYHNTILLMTKGFKTRLGWRRPDPQFGSIIRTPGHSSREYRYGLGVSKPIAIFVEMLRGFEWDVWIDPFLGSGASLLACDALGMICYGIERDPATLAAMLNRAAGSGLDVELI